MSMHPQWTQRCINEDCITEKQFTPPKTFIVIGNVQNICFQKLDYPYVQAYYYTLVEMLYKCYVSYLLVIGGNCSLLVRTLWKLWVFILKGSKEFSGPGRPLVELCALQSCSHGILLAGSLCSLSSALIVKFLTRRFITEYDPNLGECAAKTCPSPLSALW